MLNFKTGFFDRLFQKLDNNSVIIRIEEDGHYRLQPENDYMEPIIVDSVSVLGKVIGVYRLYK